MDEFMLELELLRQLEEDNPSSVEIEEKKESVSPYQNAQQEAMGQLAATFQRIDEILMAIELEEETNS